MFATAREKARGVACLSNLKQIGLAMAQYEQDFDETVPVGTNSWGAGPGWGAQVYPYVKSTAAFLCPDDVRPGDVISYAMNCNLVDYITSPLTPVPAQTSILTAPSCTVQLFEVVNCQASGFSLTSPSTDNQRSPVGNGISSSGSNGLNGANDNGTSPQATGLKFNTGVFYNAYADINPDNNVANITPTNSHFLPGGLGIHNNGANYLMADCHAKWLLASKVCAGWDWLHQNDLATCAGTWNSLAITTECIGSNNPPLTATFALR
ncbi:MAG: DUF1559 domain-containing protein [Capsulimonadaceae bacterium]|nr:DUF1559 domain-containing protein [Capsulimonadaceae bacterium]